jgi:hypothetical protein
LIRGVRPTAAATLERGGIKGGNSIEERRTLAAVKFARNCA